MSDAVTTMEWRICPRFPDYEVSECGDVRRRAGGRINQPGRRLQGHIDQDGYVRYTIRRTDGFRSPVPAHILVAEAFIGERGQARSTRSPTATARGS